MLHKDGKVVYQEVFEDRVEAAKARDRKAYALFGPFAYLNFPDEILRGQVAPCPAQCGSCPLATASTSIAPHSPAQPVL